MIFFLCFASTAPLKKCQLHAESGKGQFEIALKYILCTLAADKLIYARETIKSIARKLGLLATFLPK